MPAITDRLLVLALLPASAALAGGVHAGDVNLTINEGRLVTNSPSGPLRAFLGEFALVGGFWGTTNPGFDCLPETFQVGTSIQFHLLDAVREWDGADFDAVADAPISLEFGPAGPVTTSDTPGVRVDGFTIPVQSNGGWHRHYDFYLEEPAEAGVYLLQMSLSNPGGGAAESEPFFIVFGRSADEVEHAAAYGYVLDVLLAPCPEDINGDGIVNTADLGLLLGVFGGADDAADLNDDGVVNTADLGILLGAFGSVCP